MAERSPIQKKRKIQKPSRVSRESKKVKDKIPIPSFECPNCNQAFYRSDSYRRHLLTHLNLYPYGCKDCMDSFMQKEQLVCHRKECHQGLKRYKCNICDKRFHHPPILANHELEHTSTPPYDCPQCPALFPTMAKQTIHLHYHSSKCPFCLKPYNTDESLWNHMEKKHPNMDDCDFISDYEESESSDDSFSELDIFSDSNPFTSDEESIPSPSSKKFSGKIAHVCFICERRFRKNSSLDNHMKSHRYFPCTECSKFFPKSSLLNEHRLEHININIPHSSLQPEQTLLPEEEGDYKHPPIKISEITSDSESTPIQSKEKISLDSRGQSIERKVTASTLIAEYSHLIEKSKNLEYPLSEDLVQSIKLMISQATLSLDYFLGGEQKSFQKMHQELLKIISKNDKCLKNVK